MHTKNIQSFLPVIIIFIAVSFIAVAGSSLLGRLNIDKGLLIGGNLLLFVVTFISFFLYRRALVAGTTTTFLGNVYGGLFLKLFICLAAVFIYLFTMRTTINKGGLFLLMFLYLLYTFMEVSILMKLSKQGKNG